MELLNPLNLKIMGLKKKLKMNPLKMYVNETPSNSVDEDLFKPSASFLGVLESVNASSHLESHKSDVILQSLRFQQSGYFWYFILFYKLYYCLTLCLFRCLFALCSIAKQRIDSGFFLVGAEKKKKAKKQKIEIISKTERMYGIIERWFCQSSFGIFLLSF